MSIENVVNSPNLVTFREKKWSKQLTLYTIKEELGLSKRKNGQDHDGIYDWKHHKLDEIPEWLRPNQYIIDGHRPPLNSVRACVGSIFCLHTETGNIWSHIIGSILFLILGIYELGFSSNSSTLDFNEKIVFGLFFAGVVVCFTLSATYHTMICHSPSVETIFLRLDFTGIIIITVCHYIPCLYYGFYCSPKTMATYLTLSTVLGVLTIFVLLFDKFSHYSCYRSLRASVFAMYGSFGFIPITHFLIEQRHLLVNEPLIMKSTTCLMLMVCLYFLGAWVYSQQIPEKYYPGKYDYWVRHKHSIDKKNHSDHPFPPYQCHSHQLFHIIVVMGVIVHYMGFTYLSAYVRQLPKNFCHIQQ